MRHAASLTILGTALAACGRPATLTPTLELEAPRSADSQTSAVRELPARELPVPELVAKLHEGVFERIGAGAQLGGLACLVTLHDAADPSGTVFSLVLYTHGLIGTWRQSSLELIGPSAQEKPGFGELYHAKLSPQELESSTLLISQFLDESHLPPHTLTRSGLVMGLSLRVDGHQKTFYFDHARIPDPLERFVGLLKHRLEATHARL
jgi:hypothetical protein